MLVKQSPSVITYIWIPGKVFTLHLLRRGNPCRWVLIVRTFNTNSTNKMSCMGYGIPDSKGARIDVDLISIRRKSVSYVIDVDLSHALYLVATHWNGKVVTWGCHDEYVITGCTGSWLSCWQLPVQPAMTNSSIWPTSCFLSCVQWYIDIAPHCEVQMAMPHRGYRIFDLMGTQVRYVPAKFLWQCTTEHHPILWGIVVNKLVINN